MSEATHPFGLHSQTAEKRYRSRALRISNYVAAQECRVPDYVAAANNLASEELQISVLLDKIGVETLSAQLAPREYSTRCMYDLADDLEEIGLDISLPHKISTSY